jgi:hypothetical protein
VTDYTWGVYLRPDPLTCQAVAQLTELARRQFGIVSAAAFPPHVTLAGAVASHASAADLVQALNPVFRDVPPIAVRNAGITRQNVAVTFDVDSTVDGRKNETIKELAVAINKALEPLAHVDKAHNMKPFVAKNFRAHISLASHDLDEKPHLRHEVEQFLRAIPHAAPQSFLAETITLFRFQSDDWAGAWWHDLAWEHIHSWKLQ